MIFRKQPIKPLASIDGAIRACMYRQDTLIVDLFNPSLDTATRKRFERRYEENLHLLDRLGHHRAHEVYADLYGIYARRKEVWKDSEAIK